MRYKVSCCPDKHFPELVVYGEWVPVEPERCSKPCGNDSKVIEVRSILFSFYLCQPRLFTHALEQHYFSTTQGDSQKLDTKTKNTTTIVWQSIDLLLFRSSGLKWDQTAKMVPKKSRSCYGIDLLIKSGKIIYIFMVAFLTVRSMTKRQPAIKAK